MSADPRYTRHVRPRPAPRYEQPDPVTRGLREAPTQPTPDQGTRNGNSTVATLIVAGAAAVVAAVVVSHFWQPGTLISTAVTPIVIALLKEWLQRPAERLTRAPVVAAQSLRPTPVRPPSTEPSHGAPSPRRRPAPAPVPTAAARVTPAGPDHADSGRRRPRWKLAVLTGVAACLAAIAVLTLPELIAGRAVTSSSRGTTIFGGGGGQARHQSAPPASTKGSTTSTGSKTTSTPTSTSQSHTQSTTTTTTTATSTVPAPASTSTSPSPSTTPSTPAPVSPGAPGGSSSSPTGSTPPPAGH